MKKLTTQAEMARAVGVDKAVISRFLTGKQSPTIRTALSICKKTGLPIEIFYSRDAQKKHFGAVYLRGEEEKCPTEA